MPSKSQDVGVTAAHHRRYYGPNTRNRHLGVATYYEI